MDIHHIHLHTPLDIDYVIISSQLLISDQVETVMIAQPASLSTDVIRSG